MHDRPQIHSFNAKEAPLHLVAQHQHRAAWPGNGSKGGGSGHADARRRGVDTVGRDLSSRLYLPDSRQAVRSCGGRGTHPYLQVENAFVRLRNGEQSQRLGVDLRGTGMERQQLAVRGPAGKKARCLMEQSIKHLAKLYTLLCVWFSFRTRSTEPFIMDIAGNALWLSALSLPACAKCCVRPALYQRQWIGTHSTGFGGPSAESVSPRDGASAKMRDTVERPHVAAFVDRPTGLRCTACPANQYAPYKVVTARSLGCYPGPSHCSQW